MLFNLEPEQLSAYATLATAVIAFAALVAVGFQIIISKREARLGIAKSIYKDYLTLAFANPKFSSSSYPTEAPRIREFSNDSEEYERYEFFVSYLLFATEEILDLTKNSTGWRNTLRDQLRYHALYLSSQDFPEQHYSIALLSLREEAIKEYNAPVRGGGG